MRVCLGKFSGSALGRECFFFTIQECCVVGRSLDSHHLVQWWRVSINTLADRSASAWGHEHLLRFLLTCPLVCVLWRPGHTAWVVFSSVDLHVVSTRSALNTQVLEVIPPPGISWVWGNSKLLHSSVAEDEDLQHDHLFWLWLFKEILTKQTIAAGIWTSWWALRR